jgi:hypothetical protein
VDHLNHWVGDKVKVMLPLATLTIVLLLSACLVVPSSVYADDGKNSKDNDDKSHEKGKKDGDDKGDKDKNPTCDSEKYEKQCDDIAADKKDVAKDEAAIDKAQNDITKDIAKGQTKDVAKDQAALAKAQADLASDTADLTADLA